MFSFLIGVATGLVVGWNLLPQPAVVKRFYDRISDRFWRWITSLTLIAIGISSAGCAGIPGVPSADPYPWTERAMAEIALASVTASPSVAPDQKPKVGSKCPDCNDPPGACGVGRTGDGTPSGCGRCQLCNGDGRIDEQDIRSDGTVGEMDAESIGESILEVPKEITLHATSEQWKGWPTKWYSGDRKTFEDQGWIVRVLLEPTGATEAAYFDVQAPDGEVFNFFEPLTLAMIEHLETR